MADKNIVKDTNVSAEAIESLLALRSQVKRFSEYDGNDVVDRAVAAKQVIAIDKAMEALGIDCKNAEFNVATGHWYV